MSSSNLPERASLEYLKKLAKERLRELRDRDPDARLATAQLDVAREHGFSSWRALKAEVDRRRADTVQTFLTACSTGDVETMRKLLDRDSGLAREQRGGSTGLHAAVRNPNAVRLLLEYGADPNARDDGDNATPLHAAAGGGHIDSVRALLDAGADVQGEGDLHHLDVIGWATVFAHARRDVVDLLVERGARHHIFSAIALGDLDLIRRVARDPDALRRRLSQYEQDQSVLHYVVAPADGLVGGTFRTGDHYRTLELLIQLGADLEAQDAKGRTPLAIAMLRGDREAMQILHSAGANEPKLEAPKRRERVSLASSIQRMTPMLGVPDMQATIAWYRGIGFELAGSHVDDGELGWASMTFGSVEVMFVPSRESWQHQTAGLSLWIYTNRLDDLYASLKRRQLERAKAELAGEHSDLPDIRFTIDLYTAFYGQREFGIRDPNGIELMFAQPVDGK